MQERAAVARRSHSLHRAAALSRPVLWNAGCSLPVPVPGWPAVPDKPQSKLTADDVSTAITAYIGTMITMDENTSELFQQLAKQVLELPLDREN